MHSRFDVAKKGESEFEKRPKHPQRKTRFATGKDGKMIRSNDGSKIYMFGNGRRARNGRKEMSRSLGAVPTTV